MQGRKVTELATARRRMTRNGRKKDEERWNVHNREEKEESVIHRDSQLLAKKEKEHKIRFALNVCNLQYSTSYVSSYWIKAFKCNIIRNIMWTAVAKHPNRCRDKTSLNSVLEGCDIHFNQGRKWQLEVFSAWLKSSGWLILGLFDVYCVVQTVNVLERFVAVCGLYTT